MRPVSARPLRLTSSLYHQAFWAPCPPYSELRRIFSLVRLHSTSRRPCWTPPRAFDSLRCHVSTSTHALTEPTIYALSTAPGRAAIAIIRVSGPACVDVYQALCPGKAVPKGRYAVSRTLREPNQALSAEAVLDSNALVLYFPAPRTVTGEDVLEMHVHGGPAVVKAVLAAIPKCVVPSSATNIRYAEPGEFTRRAFMNGRLDLTQVEALGDVLSAATEQQRRLSVRGASNSLAKRYETWRHQLLYARGELEALIDFSEDQHFDESPAELCASVAEQVQTLRQMLLAHSKNAMRGEMLRNGISISLLGAPNAGKSSLLNCIVGREAAIVSQEAGTTRDVVEIGIDLGGYFCRLGDTAGLRRAKQLGIHPATHEVVGQGKPRRQDDVGHIEKEGMKRAKARAAESDCVIVVLSFEQSTAGAQLHLDAEVIDTARSLVRDKDNVVVAINKSDLAVSSTDRESAVRATAAALPGISRERIHLTCCRQHTAPSTSDLSMQGQQDASPISRGDLGQIQAFLNGLIRHFAWLTHVVTPALGDHVDTEADSSIWEDSLGASERHRLLLEKCVENLDAFLQEVQPTAVQKEGLWQKDLDLDVAGGQRDEADIVIAAEYLRAAADCLAKITGKGEAGDVEEVLGVVFEKFCVGK